MKAIEGYTRSLLFRLGGRLLAHVATYGPGVGGSNPKVVSPLVVDSDIMNVYISLLRVGLIWQPPEGGGYEAEVRVYYV